jgi:GNAT superfamily N-acetyltransferase
MLSIVPATTQEDLEAVRDLMRAFVAWHRDRHRSDIALVDAYFDAAAFEAELAGLSLVYAAPDGTVLLARIDGSPAGCGALRRLDESTGELKRMFVPEIYRGRGVGLALGQALLAAARAAGYRRLRLDTSVRQREALGLYRRLGFRPIEPYYPVSPDLRAWLTFMELNF